MTQAADDDVGSLMDTFSLRDQSRLINVIADAQPYDDFRTAYLVVAGTGALGATDVSKTVRK